MKCDYANNKHMEEEISERIIHKSCRLISGQVLPEVKLLEVIQSVTSEELADGYDEKVSETQEIMSLSDGSSHKQPKSISRSSSQADQSSEIASCSSSHDCQLISYSSQSNQTTNNSEVNSLETTDTVLNVQDTNLNNCLEQQKSMYFCAEVDEDIHVISDERKYKNTDHQLADKQPSKQQHKQYGKFDVQIVSRDQTLSMLPHVICRLDEAKKPHAAKIEFEVEKKRETGGDNRLMCQRKFIRSLNNYQQDVQQLKDKIVKEKSKFYIASNFPTDLGKARNDTKLRTLLVNERNCTLGFQDAVQPAKKLCSGINLRRTMSDSMINMCPSSSKTISKQRSISFELASVKLALKDYNNLLLNCNQDQNVGKTVTDEKSLVNNTASKFYCIKNDAFIIYSGSKQGFKSERIINNRNEQQQLIENSNDDSILLHKTNTVDAWTLARRFLLEHLQRFAALQLERNNALTSLKAAEHDRIQMANKKYIEITQLRHRQSKSLQASLSSASGQIKRHQMSALLATKKEVDKALQTAADQHLLVEQLKFQVWKKQQMIVQLEEQIKLTECAAVFNLNTPLNISLNAPLKTSLLGTVDPAVTSVNTTALINNQVILKDSVTKPTDNTVASSADNDVTIVNSSVMLGPCNRSYEICGQAVSRITDTLCCDYYRSAMGYSVNPDAAIVAGFVIGGKCQVSSSIAIVENFALEQLTYVKNMLNK